MITEDFISILKKRLEEKSIKERNKANQDNAYYYGSDYSAVNMIHNAEIFDIKADKLWIRIPNKKHKDIFAEIYIEAFKEIDFRSSKVLVNLISIDLLFINSNEKTGWHNLATYEIKFNSIKESKNKYVSYIRDAELDNQTLYEPDDELIENILKCFENVSNFLNISTREKDDIFVQIDEDGAYKRKRERFNNTFAPILKEELKDII